MCGVPAEATPNMQKELELTRSLDLNELKNLANVAGPCITIYMPLQPAPNTAQEDLVRLKSAIQQADQKLQHVWPDLPAASRRELIGSLHSIEHNEQGWQLEGGSLVVFRSPDVFRAFEVNDDLDETVVAGDYFHVLPIMHALQVAQEVFYILALSQKHVRLLRCTSTNAQHVPFPADIPTDLERWLNTRMPNTSPESEVVQEPKGSFTSYLDRDRKDEHVANFFRVINRAVFDILRDEKHPLVLCGVDYERSMYQGINAYPHLMEHGIGGSPESLKGGEMHRKAMDVVQEFFAGPAKKALDLWEKVRGTGKAIDSFPDIVKAAFEGRVAHLFAAEDARTMGVFDRNTMQMRVQGRQDDLVNAAALQTIAFGGDVFILKRGDVPAGGQIAAILRY